MHINEFALFKVVEIRNAVLILNALDKVENQREAVELIVADARTCGEYLLRYLHARADGAAGKGMVEAHQQALKGARVVKKWEQS